uniref:Uncharacterized protein n=1 Tax=Arundo donax TaxID=35708 RepID=A0A0A8ZP86_ARUDO
MRYMIHTFYVIIKLANPMCNHYKWSVFIHTCCPNQQAQQL